MTTQNTQQISGLIDQQVPGFVRQNHTKFIDFLRLYYEYLDQQENINDYIHHVIRFLDVDSTTLSFIDNFFEELRDFPSKLAVDKRLLIKHVHDFYAAKGTSQAYELLFRILFNDDVSISYPSENILKTSDGDWIQNIFITVQILSGQLPTDGTVTPIQFENKYGKFKLLPNKIEAVEWVSGQDSGATFYRLYFPSTTRILLEDHQYISAYENTTRIFLGRLTPSPSRIKILNGGKYWQLGSVFTLKGTYQDTVCKVTGVSSEGTMTACEIVYHGFGHSENQNITISPFPNKPTASAYDISRTLISYNPTVYHYQIQINDYTTAVDSILGISSESSMESYYLEDYSSEGYAGTIVFSQMNLNQTENTDPTDNDVTIDQWLASRTTVVYEFSNISRGKGYFNSDKGKISNQMMHLSDNRYYQLFSYVIHSGKQISDYKNALHLVHPAGMKYFSELEKQFVSDVTGDITASRYISVDKVYFNDVLSVGADSQTLTVEKQFSESVSLVDSPIISSNKYLTDTIGFVDSASTVGSSTYTQEDYSSESYAATEYALSLTN